MRNGSSASKISRQTAMSTEFYDATQILTPAGGYLAAYDYSLNPWRGCSFGCSYCYAAAFHTPERQQTWGDWLLVKQNAVDKVRRLRRDLRGKRVYLSSATDPYLPIERQPRPRPRDPPDPR